MLNKKSVKVLTIILLIGVILFGAGSQVFATAVGEIPSPTPSAPPALSGIANNVLNVMMWVGIVVAVGMMIFLGIKYITSSPDGKADIKGKLGVYILGLVLVLCASTIVGAIAAALP